MAHTNYPTSEKLGPSVRAIVSDEGDHTPTEIVRGGGSQELQNVSYQSKASCRVWHTQPIVSRTRACQSDIKLPWATGDLSSCSESQEPTARRLKHAGTEHKFMNSKVSLIQQALSSIL